MSGVHRTVRCARRQKARIDFPDLHRTVSGAPRKRGPRNSPASGTRSSRSTIIHRTCPVCTGLSGVPTEQRLFRRQRLPAAQLMRALRAQKSGAPILAHRTMNRTCPVCTGHPGGPISQKLQRSESNGIDDVATGLSGVPTEQRLFRRQRLPAAQLMRALRAQKSGAPILAHRTMNRTCPVCTGHPGGPISQKLQRSESNGIDDVAGGTGLSGAPATSSLPLDSNR